MRSGPDRRRRHRVALGVALAVMESASTPAGPAETRIWRAAVQDHAAAMVLTADTGNAVLFNSEHDLLVVDGRLYWAATVDGAATTELRSIPTDSGHVTVERIEGEYRLSAWPWLQSAAGGQGPLQLRNLRTDARITVGSSPAELIECSPTWCRSIVTIGTGGSTVFDMMRSDGSDRRRVGDSSVNAATVDVAILDRFEPLCQTVGDDPATSSQRLVLYDLRRKRTVRVTDRVGMILARQGILWWQTGRQATSQWHSLDLTVLAARP